MGRSGLDILERYRWRVVRPMNIRRFVLIAVPYAWLLALFFIPFFIVLKISLSDLALAIPVFSDGQGWHP